MTKLEDRVRVIEAWKQSGLSLQKYAVRVGIPYGTLQYWRKRQGEEPQPAGASFVEMASPVTEHVHLPSGDCSIVIVLPSGVRIEVH